jgi:hypothetical protein
MYAVSSKRGADSSGNAAAYTSTCDSPHRHVTDSKSQGQILDARMICVLGVIQSEREICSGGRHLPESGEAAKTLGTFMPCVHHNSGVPRANNAGIVPGVLTPVFLPWP